MYSVNWFGLGLGAIAGSVANSLVYRLPRGLDWWGGRSVCPHCKRVLSAWDLIPLLSFVFLLGKCRYCHKSIGFRYFWVELLLAFVGATQPLVILGLAFVSVVIAVMDWQTQLVSEWMLIVGVVLAAFLNFNLPGAAAGAVTIGLIWALSKGRAMGFGDVEIAAWLGLWLGIPKIFTTLWLSFVLGGAFGVVVLFFKIKKLKSRVAFGPFLITGAWLAYYGSDTIIKWIGFRL